MNKKERADLIERLDAIAAKPCLIKVGSGAHLGPFPNFDAAADYRKRILGSGIILSLIEPTDVPDFSIANELQG